MFNIYSFILLDFDYMRCEWFVFYLIFDIYEYWVVGDWFLIKIYWVYIFLILILYVLE